jgi:glycerol-3-phosphate O-acyltransferase / dihydroxyacetone phosphate acyltransferase
MGSASALAEPRASRVLEALARLIVALFYRRVEVAGLERIPTSGPLILAANHHNALMDPIVLLASVPRRLRPVAKAPLLRYPVIGQLARLAGSIAVHRRQDEGQGSVDNQAMFGASRAVLEAGGAILIFPEGVSQPEPTLMPLRTGTARMLLEARAAEPTLLPVGLIYQDPGIFREGSALVLIGTPVVWQDCAALAAAAPEEAVRRLTDRLEQALGSLIVEAKDRHTLDLVHAAEAIWREERPDAAREPAARAVWRQRAMRAYRHLMEAEPARTAAVRSRVERYAQDVERAGLGGRRLAAAYAPGTVLRYTVREGTALILGLPLALWGLLNHFVPYRLTGLAVRFLRPEADVLATYKVASGAVIFPLCWAAEGWTAWWLGGSRLLVLFLLSLLPTAFFALGSAERVERMRREARGLWTVLVDRDLQAYLLRRRRAIMTEFVDLVGRVPEAVLESARPPASRPDPAR